MYSSLGRRHTLQVPDPRTRQGLGFLEPTTIITGFAAIAGGIKNLFGRGRREADAIGPAQDQALAYAATIGEDVGLALGGCGTIAASVPTATLQNAAAALRTLRSEYLAYVRNRANFPDGRASGQSASDTMPAIDGTSGYGKWASGGSPVVGPHPNSGWGWHPPICAGGLLGAVDRELAKRKSAPRSAAASAPGGGAVLIGPSTQPVAEPGGAVAPWWAAPAAPTSTGIPTGAGMTLPGPVSPGYLAASAGSGAPAGMVDSGMLPLALLGIALVFAIGR